MAPRLYRVILPVDDVERAARCWAKLLDTPGERVSAGRHYFDCGGTILACYDAAADGAAPDPRSRRHPNEYLYFAVDDLAATRSRAEGAGCSAITAIEEMPWGERLFYALDPFGHPICFVDSATLFLGRPAD